jgi:hypothetical protein
MTAELVTLICQACKRHQRFESPGEARALGWRVYDGPTLSGAESSVRICKPCMDVAHGLAKPVVDDWTAECATCDASMAEEWADERTDDGWAKKDAEEWKRGHECEPDVSISKPKSEKERAS